MYSVLIASLLFIRITFAPIIIYDIDMIDPREFYFVDIDCDCCNKSLQKAYRYYKLDCDHVFCESCFYHYSNPKKACACCGLSLIYPEIFIYPDLFPESI